MNKIIIKNSSLHKLFFLFYVVFCSLALEVISEEIMPHKFTNEEMQNGMPKYEIPKSSRFTIKSKTRSDSESEIIYYFTPPQKDNFPIAILCGGSSLENNIHSIIHFHRYFLKEFLELGVGVITIEQEGVDSDRINTKKFMENYTRSNRLADHNEVIDHLNAHPKKGWNGKLIFLGASEGGPLVTSLTIDYADLTIATINFVGAGDFSWRDELWYFIEGMKKNIPWFMKLRAALPSWMPYSLDLYWPKSRKEHDLAMDETIKNPTTDFKLAGMTYKYHADALDIYPKHDYKKIKTPYLVISGTKDTIIDSSDVFVKKAKEAGAPITYMRILDMDHYVRKKEEVINDSFIWLKNKLLEAK